MNVQKFRAATMQAALAKVREELGPDAAVLRTREVRTHLWHWLTGQKHVEITASSEVDVPSRLPAHVSRPATPAATEYPVVSPTPSVNAEPATFDYRQRFRHELKDQIADLQSMVEELCRRSNHQPRPNLPDSLFTLFTDLIEHDVSEDLARELVERLQTESNGRDLHDPVMLQARVARMIENEIQTTGPLQVLPNRRQIVALVGPTGVGKTTTIAKLAAHYRLREKRKVGLITVDTYRIAAVEQLRTYADIIDLPMEVVATPKEMRSAIARLSDQELVLLDTAGRSPRDDVKIQELKSMLAEAAADQVHLVLSAVGSASSLAKTAERFTEVGANALLLTKLDEAAGLGNLLPVLRASKLPLSYVTNGQRVPDDIQAADRGRLANLILGMERVSC